MESSCRIQAIVLEKNEFSKKLNQEWIVYYYFFNDINVSYISAHESVLFGKFMTRTIILFRW